MSYGDSKGGVPGWAKAAIGLVGVFGVATAGLYAFSPRVNENEIGMRIVRGALVDESVDTGVKMDAILPHVQYNQFTRTLTTGEVRATQEDDVTIRTSDKLRVYGGFRFKFLVDDTHEDWDRAWTFLKANSTEDMIDDIGDYLMPAAIDVYGDIAGDNINDDLIAVGETIRERAQATLDSKGLGFIKMQDVIPTGMGLSDEADSLIEQQATESRRLSIDATRRELAAQQAETIVDQTAVTVNAISALVEAGLDADQALYALCLQQNRDGDVLGDAAACIPAGAETVVAVGTEGGSSPQVIERTIELPQPEN